MPPPTSRLDQAQALISAGKLDAAKQMLQRMLRTAPGDAGACDAMRAVLLAQGNIPQALHFAERAHRAAPDHPGAMADYGALLAAVGRNDEAKPIIERAIALDGRNRQAHFAFVALLFAQSRVAEAEAAARRAIEQLGGDHDIAMKLVAAHLSLGEAHRGAALLSAMLFRHPDDRSVAESLATVLNYDHTAEAHRVFQSHLNFGRVLEQADLAQRVRHEARAPGAARPARLRVAILSADLRQHSVGYFAEPILEHLDRERFELLVYDTSRKPDAMTERMKRYPATWRRCAGMAPAALAGGIAGDRPDLLIELSGLTVGHSLDALRFKPAPIQVTYLGFPNTTGLRTMDWRIVDSLTDPAPAADALAVERLARLDPCFLCFRPPEGAPEPARAGGGSPTFACFNALTKVNDAVLAAWARVLGTTPGSRLLLKSRELEAPDVREHLRRRCAAAGIDVERIELLEPTKSLLDHLAIYNRVDAALDTFPYHGTTTTCEALWMGVPVVSLTGDRHATRVGLSLLSAVGEGPWAADTLEDYVALAARAGGERRGTAERVALRARVAASPLCDAPGFARRLGALLDQLWARSPADATSAADQQPLK